eukprot:jgi/Psemu1/1004/gm1.1004_g
MPPAKGRKSGASNYSRAKLLQVLNTIKELLPISPNEWDAVALIHKDKFSETDRNAQNLCRKYTNLHRRQIPTGNPNCPEEVKLAKKIKKLIVDRAHVVGYRNSNRNGEDDDLDISDVNIPPLSKVNIPPIGVPVKRPYSRNKVNGKEIISSLRKKREQEDTECNREDTAEHMRTIMSTLVNIANLFVDQLTPRNNAVSNKEAES